MSTGSSSLSLDPISPSEQLCYVHCTLCDTLLAVSVPCSSLYKTVTVRCGHCANLLPVNLRSLLLPSPVTNQFSLGHNLFSPSTHNLLGQMPNQSPNFSLTQPSGANNYNNSTPASRGGSNELPTRTLTSNRLSFKLCH